MNSATRRRLPMENNGDRRGDRRGRSCFALPLSARGCHAQGGSTPLRWRVAMLPLIGSED